MPRRLTPLVNNQIYHIFNRGLDHRRTFINKLQFNRAIEVTDFYRFFNPPVRLSKFLKMSNKDRRIMTEEIKKNNDKLIDILAYCLMPNHFHFLVKQLRDNGISKFMANFQNSYTRYFNIQTERTGALFLNQFKSVRVETNEQFLHVSRYIHLNPLTSSVVNDFESLKKYSWSSLREYIENKAVICNINPVLDFFRENNSYISFIKDQSEYQKKLHRIRHLLLD